MEVRPILNAASESHSIDVEQPRCGARVKILEGNVF